MIEDMNWKKAWENPREMIETIMSNEASINYIKSIKNRLKKEIKQERKIKKGGYVIESERKQNLIASVNRFDRELSERLKKINNKDEAIKLFEERIPELKKKLELLEKQLRIVLQSQKNTFELSEKAVDKYLAVLAELKIISQRQISNIDLNYEFEKRLEVAAREGSLKKDIAKYVKEAKLANERAKENRLMEERAQNLISQTEELESRSKELQTKFEKETNEINSIKRFFRKMFKMNEKDDDKYNEEDVA